MAVGVTAIGNGDERLKLSDSAVLEPRRYTQPYYFKRGFPFDLLSFSIHLTKTYKR